MAKKRIITNPNFLVEKIDGKLTLKVKDGGINRKVSSSENNSCLDEFMLSVTYSELKQLSDNSKLIPGMQYRITDYECTTTQLNTRSAGHPFDIIVTADSKNSLNENARATNKMEQRPTFNYNGYVTYEGVRYDVESRWFYDGDKYIEDAQQIMSVWLPEDPSSVSMFGDNPHLFTLQGVTDIQDIMTDVYIDINDTVMPYGTFSQFVQPAEIYPSSGMDYDNPIVKPMLYWKNSKLEAWELKYCLDNDVDRFEWASKKSIRSGFQSDYIMNYTAQTKEVKGTLYYYWRNDETGYNTYTLSPNPSVGDDTWLYKEETDEMIDDGGVINIYEDGKGVIYYMKDEYGNECPYDFKNIMFDFIKESLGWIYTFTKDGKDATLLESNMYKNNKISSNGKSFNFITLIDCNICSGNVFGYNSSGIIANLEGGEFCNNTFTNNILNLKIVNPFSKNVIYPGDYNLYAVPSETVGKILCLNNGSPVIGELTVN